jgi:hypothetical protein
MVGKKWGAQSSGSKRFERRYARLRLEGFVHEEAVRLAEGIICSKKMLEGRRRRRRWLKEAIDHGVRTVDQLEKAVDDLYDAYDWYDPWSQFYPEKEHQTAFAGQY